MSRSKKRKSQMEMFGIAFVVILVALGMLFAVRFAVRKPASTAKEQFTQKELAQNFVTTLLTTSTGCRNTGMTELLEDCGTFQLIDCNGVDSCTYSREMIGDILENTLNAWNRAYRFEAKTSTDQLVYFENEPERCVESRPGWGYIPLGAGGTLVVRLDIC